jgi:integrase
MTGFIVTRCEKQHDRKTILHDGPCRFAIVVADGHKLVNGKRRQRQRWISFRASDAATTIKKAAAEARAKLAEIITAQKAGELVRPTTDTTLIAYLRTWLDSSVKVERRPATYRSYRFAIEKHIAAHGIAAMKLSEIRLLDVEHYLKSLKGSRSLLKVHRAVLHRALKQAVRHGLLKTNPATGAELPTRTTVEAAPAAKVNCWGTAEAVTFLRTVDAEHDPQMAAFAHLALDTGARKSELFGLRWADVDLDARTVRIERQLDHAGRKPVFGPTKTKGNRSIEVTAQTVARLRAHRQAQAELKMANRTTYVDFDLVFAREERDRRPGTRLGEPIKTLSEERFRALVKKAGVRVITPHGLRHTCATMLLAAGEPPIDVAGRLGHRDATVTLTVYAHALPQNQRRTADRVAALLAVGS